jgi:integrase
MSAGNVPLATFFEELFLPLALRRCCGPYQQRFREAIGWLEKVLGRPPLVADLETLTLELALVQLARAGLGHHRIDAIRKRWLSLWRFAARLGWAVPVPPLGRRYVALPPSVARPPKNPKPPKPWLAAEPGDIVDFFNTQYTIATTARHPRWRDRYESLFAKMHRCFGRNLRLGELSRERVAAFVAWMTQAGMHPRSIRHYRSALSTIWRLAAELGAVATEVPAWRKMRIPRQAPEAWTDEQCARIVAAAGELQRPDIGGIPAGKLMKAAILIVWWTALRRRSLLEIRVADIDLAGWLVIPGERIKTGVGLKFKLGQDAVAAIGEILHPERELLFPARPELLNDCFRAILKLAGVPRGRSRNGLWHQLRRSVATALANRAGTPAAAALLGHSSPTMTIAAYIDRALLDASDTTNFLPSLTDLARRNNLNNGDQTHDRE